MVVSEIEWGILFYRNVIDNFNIEFFVDFCVMGNNCFSDYFEWNKKKKIKNFFKCVLNFFYKWFYFLRLIFLYRRKVEGIFF